MRKGANLFQVKKEFQKALFKIETKGFFFFFFIKKSLILRKWFQLFIFQCKKFNSNFLIWKKNFEKTLDNDIHIILVKDKSHGYKIV